MVCTDMYSVHTFLAIMVCTTMMVCTTKMVCTTIMVCTDMYSVHTFLANSKHASSSTCWIFRTLHMRD